MGKFSRDQSGSGAVEAVLIIVILGIVGFTGYYVWHAKNNTDKTLKVNDSQTQQEKLKNTTYKTTNPYEGWLSYTSIDGNFTFQYPKDWYMAAGGTGESQGEISLEPLTSQASTKNVYRMTLWVTSASDAYPDIAAQNGTTTERFNNGVNVWTMSEKAATNPNSGSSVCPYEEIINSSSTHFSHLLANGKFLTFQGGYCEGERDTTDLTYSQQLASQSWQQSLKILESIKFN